MPGPHSQNSLFLCGFFLRQHEPLRERKSKSLQHTGAFMNLKKCITTGVVLLVAAVGASAQNAAKPIKDQAPPMLGIHWAKGIHPARSGGSPDMTFHGGTVLT